MRPVLIIIGLLIASTSYCQKYKVGLIKTGSTIKNVQGQIIITDSTVISRIGDQSSTFKITSRKAFSIHFKEGAANCRYVISHPAGRLHGFNYDRAIHYHSDKHHPTNPKAVFYCLIQRDSLK